MPVTPGAPVLELRDVTFRRDGTDILRGVDLLVGEGEHWAMLGPNGAGKSTLLGFCAARTHPTSGTVDVLGQRLGRVDTAQLRKQIGHVDPRHRLSSPLTAREVVLTGITGTIDLPMRWEPTADEVGRADARLDEVGLVEHRDSVWQSMSQGERGRALIARALIAQPRLLLLDEPTTGLDVAAREQYLATMDRLAAADPGMTSVLVTHHLEELPETTTHAVLVSRGAITAAGPVDQALTTRTVSDAFHHPIEVSRVGKRFAARAAR
ncbi:ATP-binding cassette domain-containing protein [Gordonia sp. X0973]|uniref:ABC transporter ATP-binding protein n=1 Tax=Gordonia sp. X0973 TaxID=2742602 RepID=UPI000F52227C|nr:ATP-binding cassette domain-containing protein [Gordonia sp. X0973]QKT07396.1 ATP-binding cassette domain-containing protein [Gordonia sp. X0973]